MRHFEAAFCQNPVLEYRLFQSQLKHAPDDDLSFTGFRPNLDAVESEIDSSFRGYAVPLFQE